MASRNFNGAGGGIATACGSAANRLVTRAKMALKGTGTSMELASADTDSWQSECGEVRARVSGMWTRGLWTDCELVVGEAAERLPAHRVLLASASPVFAAMLYGPMRAQPDTQLSLPTIEPEPACLLLEYIYTDNINISSCHIACNLYRAAHLLLISHLETVCRAYLLSNVTHLNVLLIYEFAQLYSDNELLEKSLKVMQTDTMAILANVGETEVPCANTLVRMFALPELNIRSEMELFHAAQRWVQHHYKKNENVDTAKGDAYTLIRPALQQIRFLTMDPLQFARTDMRDLLSQDEVMAISLNMLSSESHLPMPQGFSVSKESRCQKYKKSGVLKTEIAEVLKYKYSDTFISTSIYVQGLEWSLGVKMNDTLQISVLCKSDQNLLHFKDFTCNATVKTRLISHAAESIDLLHTVHKQFQSNSSFDINNQLQWTQLLSRKDLINLSKGYIKDGKVSFEVHIDAQPPVRRTVPPPSPVIRQQVNAPQPGRQAAPIIRQAPRQVLNYDDSSSSDSE